MPGSCHGEAHRQAKWVKMKRLRLVAVHEHMITVDATGKTWLDTLELKGPGSDKAPIVSSGAR
jgi:hypothetical protein